jgi:hypothetical protein
MDQGPGGSSGRFQVRLWDLVVVVLGASYVLDVARRSRVAWGGGLPDLAHGIGLLVLTLGVGVGLVLVGQWVRRLRERGGRVWSSICRALALSWLVGALIEVAAALQIANTTGPLLRFGGLREMRLEIASLMATLGMVGLMLASYPLGTRATSSIPRPRWGSWPGVTFATVVGIAILGLGHGAIPYLVLLAIEFVRHAMWRAPLVARPFVLDRLMTCCVEALPGLIGCYLTAVWVDDDLRAAARDPLGARAPRSWWGVFARFATLALAASGLAYVLLISIPTLHPWLAEGLSIAMDQSTIATITLGFAALAAGFSARAAAHLASGTVTVDRPAGLEPTSRRLGVWPRRIIGGMVALACLEITAAAVQSILGDLESRWYIPIPFERWTSILDQPARYFGYTISGWYLLTDRLDALLIAIAATWLTIRLASLTAPKNAGRPTPFDLIGGDRLVLGRFLGWWVGLTTVMVASLPGLAIVGVTLFHFVARWLAK